MLRAFHKTKSKVVGNIDIELEISPHIFLVPFQIINSKPVYSILPKRPRIHSVKAIPLSLHQKIKYVVDGKLVIILGEESLWVFDPLMP